MASPLALSANATVQVERIGQESLPLLTIDACLADPDAVVAIAAAHAYRPIGPHYPGVRSPVSARIAMPLVAPLVERLVDLFDLAASPCYHEAYLSIMTTPAEQLAPIQRLPHFDGVEPDRLAVLLYLDRAERAGTAFYRQAGTGFESVDAARLDGYRAALDAAARRHGVPAGYIAGSGSLFEQIHRAEGRYNRMIIYRGNSLHCAAPGPDFAPTAKASSGRLTLNLFLAGSGA